MKNLQKGFIVPLLIAVISLLVMGGGVAYFTTKTPTSSQNIGENNYQPQENQNSVSNIPIQNTVTNNTTNQQIQNGNSTNTSEIKSEISNILYPAGKEKFNRYQVIEVKWQKDNFISWNASYLYLCTEQKDDCKELLIAIPKEADNFTWPVGTAYNGDLKVPSGNYILKLDSYYSEKGKLIKNSPSFSGVFTILPSEPGYIKIISPKKGDVVNFNESFDIKWESRNIESFKPLKIYLNMQVPTGGDNVEIWESISDTGFYKWFPNIKENYEVYDGGVSGLVSIKDWLKMPSKDYELRICVFVPIVEEIPAKQVGNKMYIDPRIGECSDPFLIEQ